MEEKVSLKVRVQKLGTSLSNMVMPNIGAFIAWGVLTALFIADGYLVNHKRVQGLMKVLKSFTYHQF
ncbi:PTS system mannitol-specific transporter subunit EIIBC [Streptococcus pneumoniae]|nr:PTS system mannitol-specific transporter subunit EIIBC [Streptococcus pneumoniae]